MIRKIFKFCQIAWLKLCCSDSDYDETDNEQVQARIDGFLKESEEKTVRPFVRLVIKDLCSTHPDWEYYGFKYCKALLKNDIMIEIHLNFFGEYTDASVRYDSDRTSLHHHEGWIMNSLFPLIMQHRRNKSRETVEKAIHKTFE